MRDAKHRRILFVLCLYVNISSSYNTLKPSVKMADAIYGAVCVCASRMCDSSQHGGRAALGPAGYARRS